MAVPGFDARLLGAAARGECPRCGARTLFRGPLRFAPRCARCDLDIAGFNVGDGPAAFQILIIGALVTVLALVLQVKVSPPFWVHILLWVPLTLLLVVGALRVGKGALLILEYHNQAREGGLRK